MWRVTLDKVLFLARETGQLLQAKQQKGRQRIFKLPEKRNHGNGFSFEIYPAHSQLITRDRVFKDLPAYHVKRQKMYFPKADSTK